jgi:hypothetical protein
MNEHNKGIEKQDEADGALLESLARQEVKGQSPQQSGKSWPASASGAW